MTKKKRTGKQRMSSYAKYAFGFGDEDPGPGKGKKSGVYTTQAQIDTLNANLKDFAKRHATGMVVNPEDVTSGKKIGDPLFQTVDLTGRSASASKKAFTLPPEVGYNDIYKDNTGAYYYDHPQTGNAVEIDPSLLNLPRFAKDRQAQQAQTTTTNPPVAKFATGGKMSWSDFSAAPGIASSIIDLIEQPNPNDYSTQPIVNASTMHGMDSPYKGFAFGDDGGDISEDDMAALQEYADQNGIPVEDLLQQLSGQVADENPEDQNYDESDTDMDMEQEQAPDEDDQSQQEQTPDLIDNFSSPDELYEYGGIHIKKKNRGKFTASAKKAGQSVQGFAAHVLANKKKYSSTLVKRANFARNAAKWHHAMGGNAGMYESYAGGGWIKKAAASIKRRGTKGKCTPITKPGCTGRARALALTFKKIARKRKHAMGGTGNNIEVEGQEVLQYPNGGMYQVKGPSHEEGGVDMNVPDGTKIYSDRLTIDGKTMQQRKVAREKRINKIKKALDTDPYNRLARNSFERTMFTHQDEERKDMAMQKVANKIYNMGGETAAYGDPGVGLWNPDIANSVFSMNAATDAEVLNNQYPVVGNIGAPIGKDIGIGDNEGLFTTTPTLNGATNPSGKYNWISANSDITTPDSTWAGKGVVNPPAKTPTPYSGQLTAGDWTGLAGNAFNAIAPIINTRRNQRFTKPNINRYRGFAHEALDTNDAEQRIASGLRTSALTDIDTASNSQTARNRSGARGVNTLRNLDIATRMASDKAKQGANDSFAKEMLGVLGNRTSLQIQKDQYERMGETQRDVADKQDLDNYFSNMAQNLTNFGTNVQGIGRNLNTARGNRVNANLLAQMSKYGLGFDKNGNIISMKRPGQ